MKQVDCSDHKQSTLPYLFLKDNCGDRRAKACILFSALVLSLAQLGAHDPTQLPRGSPIVACHVSVKKHVSDDPLLHSTAKGGIRTM